MVDQENEWGVLPMKEEEDADKEAVATLLDVPFETC